MQHEDDDRQLIARIRHGDNLACNELAQRYRAALVRFASSMLGDAAAAEDVAHETLARLRDADLPRDEPRPWLYRIARNLCLDLLRRRRISPTYGGSPPTGFDAPAQTAGPATRAAADERSERVRRALGSVPDEYREVLVLRHFEGLSREEIATVLELSDAAVKGRLARGAECLRTLLRDETSAGGKAP